MKDSHKTYIKSFSLQGLWGYKEVEWTTINSDVNVLVGINGSGKTTLMDIMYAYYTNDAKELKNINIKIFKAPSQHRSLSAGISPYIRYPFSQ